MRHGSDPEERADRRPRGRPLRHRHRQDPHRRHRAQARRRGARRSISRAGSCRRASSRPISISTSPASSTAARRRSGDLDEAIGEVAAAKKKFTPEDVYRRGKRTLEKCILNGTTHVRTQLEVDPGIGLRGLEGMLPLIDEYKWAIDLEICIFPQEGLLNNPGTDELMVEALKRGGKVVGAAPYTDSNPHGQIDRVFEMAREFDIDIDMHLDFGADPGQSRSLSRLRADRALRLWRTGRDRPCDQARQRRAGRLRGGGEAHGRRRRRLDRAALDRPLSHGPQQRHEPDARRDPGAPPASLGRQLLALDQQRAQSLHALRRLLARPHGQSLRQHLPGRRAAGHPRMLQHDHHALRQARCASPTTGLPSASRPISWCSIAPSRRARWPSWCPRSTASSAGGRPSPAGRPSCTGRIEPIGPKRRAFPRLSRAAPARAPRHIRPSAVMPRAFRQAELNFRRAD